MTEPATATAGGIAAWKLGAGILGVGVVASALGFLVRMPKTPKEAFVRLCATMAGSALLGPLFVIATYWKYPEVFGAATRFYLEFGVHQDIAGLIALLTVSAPLLAMAGLPFWWILGAAVLWMEKRKGKDLGQWVRDFRKLARG